MFFILVSHGLIQEVYYNISSDSIFNLNSSFPLNPDFLEVTDDFNAPQIPIGYYIQRIRGWFLPYHDGNYTFYSSCKMFCELYLSNGIDPQNKNLIIQQLPNSTPNQYKSVFILYLNFCLYIFLYYFFPAFIEQS